MDRAKDLYEYFKKTLTEFIDEKILPSIKKEQGENLLILFV